MAYQCLLHICLIVFLISKTTVAIMCYICGQTNLKPPGECTTQFQYDCSTLGSTSQRGSKILCRTTRSRIGENLFAVGKECITERDHLTRYPDGKTNGCDTLDKNGSHELNYCICDRNLCNSRNIDDQINEHNPQQHIMTNPVVVVPPDGINITIGAWQTAGVQADQSSASQLLSHSAQGQPLPVPPQFPNITNVDPELVDLQFPQNLHTVAAVTVNSREIQVHQASIIFPPSTAGSADVRSSANSNLFPVQRVETSHIVLAKTENPSNSDNDQEGSLICAMCAESNVSATHDCREPVDVDCFKMFPGETELMCLSKSTLVSSDQTTIEKRCISKKSAVQDLKLTTVVPGCSEMRDTPVSFKYCLCSTSKCNSARIAVQMGDTQPANGQATKQIVSSIIVSSNTTSSLICYACSESNLKIVSDCSRQYENSCAPQNSSEKNVKMLCLTRQIKLASGLFSIEKRCISEMEHRQQYPGFQVVLNGCGEAWNGNEQYCVCDKRLCNKQNITIQKEFSQQETATDHIQSSTSLSTTKTIPSLNNETVHTSTFKSLKKNDVLASSGNKLSNKQVGDKGSGSSASKIFFSNNLCVLLSFFFILFSLLL